MNISKFFHFFIFFLVIYASEDYCRHSWCSNDNILIRFPFQVEVEGDQYPYCGYPGFKLTCTNDSKTVLTLPYTGAFYVRKINYHKQYIQLYDPHDCLPNRLLSLNLSSSPFTAKFITNYTLLICSTRNIRSQFIPLECLSNSTHFVSAIPSMNFTNSLPQSCYVNRKISIPVARSYDEIFRNYLSEDLLLTWSSPDCRHCELQDGMCKFESRNSDRVRCFSDHQTGDSKHAIVIFRIIILSIGGAAMMCAIGMGCLTHFKRRRTISAEPTIDITITRMRMGLDETTIESFDKIVLGESRRLPGVGHNDGTGCSICLSEYNSKDIIRCIPKCTHCFHVHCIDEWLRMNSTCPLCRNSPSPSHSVLHSIS